VLPAITVRRPLLFQPADRRRRQVRRVLAEQRRKRLLEIAGRDAAQVENRQQGIEALRPPRPFRQDRLCEGDAIAAHLACCIATTVAQLGAPHRNWADPRLDLTLRTMAVPHHTGAVIGKPFVLHRSQERIRLRLNRLGQKPACGIAQNRRQGIVEVVWMLKVRTVLSVFMAYRPFGRFWQALSPAWIRRLSQTVITQLPP
jgi:hypothetical protein